MSITHSESGEPDSLHSSGDSKELTDQSGGDYPVEGAIDEFRSVISPMTIASENWVAAEDAVQGIIHKVRPTSESEDKRREVVTYIQRLMGRCLGVEVLPYGSVPLRTYLPDGDIDLTAFGAANFEDMLVDDMKFILQREEKNMAAPFRIKDVQLIRAEVKLVKCIVQNIVVDISFNQIGGLCTLCFLEQIDRLIGKDHLFKTSIILIKAWCYYESRILGSHHGLISTYALETLVLYIFHLYHSTLDGPLAVLYKFLDYFSKFDWETYCISLSGPIRISSLPDIVVDMPEDSDENLLLTSDFMSFCVDRFSVPSRGGDQVSRGLQQKHLNIVDPLRENNNLGRSVSKGNFYRVRSAFTYGAKKLARILILPQETIADELHKFFSNTMARHGSSQRPDIQDLNPSTCNGFMSLPPAPEMRSCANLYEDAIRDSNSCTDILPENLTQGIEVSSDLMNGETNRNLLLTNRFHGDANELASSGLRGLKISKASSGNQSPKQQMECVIPAGKFCYVSHDHVALGLRDGNQDLDTMEAKCESPKKDRLVEKHEVESPSKPRDLYSNHEQVLMGNGEVAESLNSLTDLTGDYENYFRHLQYGRWFYELGMPSPYIPIPPNAPYLNKLWDGAHPPSQFKRNGFSNQHPKGSHRGPAVYGMPPHMLMQGMPFGWEEGPKHPRGTGYFPHIPNMPLPPRPPAMLRPPFCNGRDMIYPGSYMEMVNHEPSQSQVSGEKNVQVGPVDGSQMFPPQGNEYPNSNGFIPQPEEIPEFGSFGPQPRSPMPESKQQTPGSSSPGTPSDKQKSQPDFGGELDRVSMMNSYHLKDEDDFPPL